MRKFDILQSVYEVAKTQGYYAKNSFFNNGIAHFGLAFGAVGKDNGHFLYVELFDKSPVFHFDLKGIANKFYF
jgi:hypothetical protein